VNLHLDETIRRNLRKTPEERVETLLSALREAEARGLLLQIDRKSKRTAHPVFAPQQIIETLNRHEAQFVIIGGFAATLYGCPEQTFDLDILYADTPANRTRLLKALDGIEAKWDEPLTDAVLQRQAVFALNTKYGDLDILSEVLGLGSYENAQSHVQTMRFYNQSACTLICPR
jgi:hypothetical protein